MKGKVRDTLLVIVGLTVLTTTVSGYLAATATPPCEEIGYHVGGRRGGGFVVTVLREHLYGRWPLDEYYFSLGSGRGEVRPLGDRVNGTVSSVDPVAYLDRDRFGVISEGDALEVLDVRPLEARSYAMYLTLYRGPSLQDAQQFQTLYLHNGYVDWCTLDEPPDTTWTVVIWAMLASGGVSGALGYRLASRRSAQ